MTEKPSAYKGNEPYIFISYAHADDKMVMPLIEGLQARGFRVWYDEGIADSALWQRVIAEHLAKSRCVIAFISQSALASPNCRKEINFAVNLSERPGSNHASPLPVYLDDAEMDYEMQMVLLPLQSRYYSRYSSIEKFLDSLKTSAALQACRAMSDAEKACIDWFSQAKLLQSEGKHGEAAELFRKAAEQGHAKAQCSLGSCCSKGQGVPRDDAEAAKWFRKAAEQGYDAAQNNLAYCYYCGKGVPQDYAQAAAWYRRAAEQGLSHGQFGLARCYENGHGVPQDLGQALQWYRKARDGGHVKAAEAVQRCEDTIKKQSENPDIWYERAEKLHNDEEYEEAAALYREAAEAGHAEAQVALGRCYHNGEGVDQSDEEALKWYRRSAEQGSVEGIEQLGSCLIYTFNEIEEGRKNWQLAAERGSISAATALAFIYEQGILVKMDLQQALIWYRKAKELGSDSADEHIRSCEEKLRKQSVPLDAWFSQAEKLYSERKYREAVELYRKAAQYDHSASEYKLASCYQQGFGVPTSFEKAVEWYRRSADHGNAGAQYTMGCYYDWGLDVEQDYGEAIRWFRKAADQGHAAAMERLGDFFYHGYGVSQNYMEAFNAYVKAYKLDKARGFYGLARCYENGHGVAKDLEKAIAWYRYAKTKGHSKAEDDIRRCEAAMKKKKSWWDF